MTLRRQFELPSADENFLQEYGVPWETVNDGSQWVFLQDFPMPEGYEQSKVTAAIRLEVGYPNAALDMVYFHPPIARKDGKPIGATQVTQAIDGKSFQRWSRHRTEQNPWRIGFDSLGSHLLLVEDWLSREFGQ